MSRSSHEHPAAFHLHFLLQTPQTLYILHAEGVVHPRYTAGNKQVQHKYNNVYTFTDEALRVFLDKLHLEHVES